METDLALSYEVEYRRGPEHLSGILWEMLERGRQYPALEYNRALARIPIFNSVLEDIFQEKHAIVTPATAGEAPRGLESTGNPAFGTIWTLCGLPAVTVPLMEGPDGMPMGVQLVGPRGDDARLLQCARWLVEYLSEEEAA